MQWDISQIPHHTLIFSKFPLSQLLLQYRIFVIFYFFYSGTCIGFTMSRALECFHGKSRCSEHHIKKNYVVHVVYVFIVNMWLWLNPTLNTTPPPPPPNTHENQYRAMKHRFTLKPVVILWKCSDWVQPPDGSAEWLMYTDKGTETLYTTTTAYYHTSHTTCQTISALSLHGRNSKSSMLVWIQLRVHLLCFTLHATTHILFYVCMCVCIYFFIFAVRTVHYCNFKM